MGDIYEERLADGCSTKVSLTKAHFDTHDIMTKSAGVNAELSGTTTVIASLRGSELTIAYAGDSAAIIGSKSSRRAPTLLTNPHDLSRPDEVRRIERKGGLVMSPEEYDAIKGHMVKSASTHSLHALIESDQGPESESGFEPVSETERNKSPSKLEVEEKTGPMRRKNRRSLLNDSRHFHQSLSDLMSASLHADMSNDNLNQSLHKMIRLASTNSLISLGSEHNDSSVPRIWSGTSVEKVPGCAFTRSVGDIVAHGIGVTEKPEFNQLVVQHDDVIVVASDGVTEYLDAAAIVKIVSEIDDPAVAARTLVKASSELWAEKNDYCDDSTLLS